MFHVEHRFLSLIFGLIMIHLLASCTNADPNPELKDPIYNDILSQKANTEKELTETEEIWLETLADYRAAAPQTGQVVPQMRKVFEAKNRVDILKQQVKYWTIRGNERLLQSRLSYHRSLTTGKPWPDKNEVASYKAEKKLRQAKVLWDSKERQEIFKREHLRAPTSIGNQDKSPTSEH